MFNSALYLILFIVLFLLIELSSSPLSIVPLFNCSLHVIFMISDQDRKGVFVRTNF